MQATAAHAINISLTFRNWLIGYYIVEFEQNGEDRAKYGEKLLQNLEEELNIKSMTERRFREYRRIYTIYPQIGEEIANLLPAETITRLSLTDSNLSIRRTVSAESENTIRRTLSAELQEIDNDYIKWRFPAKILLSKLPYSHLLLISKIENPVKRAFYELESTKGNWSVR
jgi:predicted nuclease of restriction endonuclease-like (RecB) superfamily